MTLKHLSLGFLILCLSTVVQAQGTLWPDSLGTLLKKAKTGHQKAELLYERGDQIAIYDTVTSIRYIREGLKYVTGDPFYEGIGYFYLGRAYMEFSPMEAEKAFDTAIRYFQQVSTPEAYIYQSRTWANKGCWHSFGATTPLISTCFLKKLYPSPL
ncbi:MAG: hypothetical protein KF870_15465 [Leadbetterella sp.]|nr:hypothetical protein [Leadbetterella sp.]